MAGGPLSLKRALVQRYPTVDRDRQNVGMQGRARKSQVPQFLGGYVRGPLVPGGPLIPVLVALVALLVVGDNALELLQGA